MNRKLLRRILALLCCILLCLSMGLTCFAYGGVSNWAIAEVTAAEELGFIPPALRLADLRQPMTRLEMCQVAVRAFEAVTGTTLYPTARNHFKDTVSNDVCIAYELGIVSGYTDGTFRANQQITRQEYARIVLSFLEALGWDPSAMPAQSLVDLKQFSDYRQLSGWAQEATQAVVYLEVVYGNTDGTLAPKSTTSVEQALVMFLRAYDVLSTEEGKGVIGGAAEPTESEALDYSGVSNWARASIARMETLGLLPESLAAVNMKAPITRGQMCEVAALTYAQLTGKAPEATGSHFTDTSRDVINSAYELGLISGFPDGTFRETESLTREQFFQITYNFLRAGGWEIPQEERSLESAFSDADKIASWAKPAAEILYEMNVMVGSGGKFLPAGGTTREQGIAMFMRAYVQISDWYLAHPLTEIDGPQQTANVIDKIVALAVSMEGMPYVFAAASPSVGFDCSGLAYYVYGQFGYKLHRSTYTMIEDGISVSYSEIRPGDLILFYHGPGTAPHHVGIYIGDGKMIHAANTTRGVVIDNFNYDNGASIHSIRRIIY